MNEKKRKELFNLDDTYQYTLFDLYSEQDQFLLADEDCSIDYGNGESPEIIKQKDKFLAETMEKFDQKKD